MKRLSVRFLCTASATLLFSVFLFSTAQARHHHHHRHKFKGLVVVNQIVKLVGTITNNGRPAVEYSGVRPGDDLETGDKSLAVIRIPGLGIYQMNDHTELLFKSFHNRDQSRLELDKGDGIFLFRRMGEHEVETPNLHIKLDGFKDTTFYASADHLDLCAGKISVSLADADQDSSHHFRHPSSADDTVPSPPANVTSDVESKIEGPAVPQHPSSTDLKAGPPITEANGAPSPSPSSSPGPTTTAATPVVPAAKSAPVTALDIEVTDQPLKVTIEGTAPNRSLRTEPDPSGPCKDKRVVEDLDSVYSLP